MRFHRHPDPGGLPANRARRQEHVALLVATTRLFVETFHRKLTLVDSRVQASRVVQLQLGQWRALPRTWSAATQGDQRAGTTRGPQLGNVSWTRPARLA